VAKPDEMSIAKSVLLDVLRECNVTDPGTLEWASAQLEARVEKLMRDKLAAAEVSDCGKYSTNTATTCGALSTTTAATAVAVSATDLLVLLL
jgi:hypothetical protein